MIALIARDGTHVAVVRPQFIVAVTPDYKRLDADRSTAVMLSNGEHVHGVVAYRSTYQAQFDVRPLCTADDRWAFMQFIEAVYANRVLEAESS